jgi:hypothetical protein
MKKKQKERKKVPRGEPKKKQQKELRLLWKTKENCS